MRWSNQYFLNREKIKGLCFNQCANWRGFRYTFICNTNRSWGNNSKPYLAFDSLYQRHKKTFGQYSFDECVERYIKSVNAGLLKIMSKMGISVLSSYRGGCNFETVGLSRSIVNDYFPGVTSKISGIGLLGIEKNTYNSQRGF